MRKASYIAASIEVMLLALIVLYAMIKASAGSGLPIIFSPFVWLAAVIRIKITLAISSAVSPNRRSFIFFGTLLGMLSGIAVGTLIGEKSLNLLMLSATLTISTVVGCIIAPDET